MRDPLVAGGVVALVSFITGVLVERYTDPKGRQR